MKKLVLVVAVLVVFGLMVSPAQACRHRCEDGAPGADGINGVDGNTGADGVAGSDGVDGLAGAAGVNGNDATCQQRNEIGVGLDWVLYEKGDYVPAAEKESWLQALTIQYRCDLRNEPRHEAYLVGKVKLWNK